MVSTPSIGTMQNYYTPGDPSPAQAVASTLSGQLFEQLAEVEAERQRILEAQRAEAAAEAAREAAETESKIALAVWVAKEVQRRLLLGGVTPDLVAEYLRASDNPTNEVMELYQQAFSSPVYGLELKDKGFYFAGEQFETVLDLQRKLDTMFGRFSEFATGDFLEALIAANIQNEPNPINYALTHTNPFPTNLEQTEANKLYNLTGYHHKLGSLMPSTPQRTHFAESNPE